MMKCYSIKVFKVTIMKEPKAATKNEKISPMESTEEYLTVKPHNNVLKKYVSINYERIF